MRRVVEGLRNVRMWVWCAGVLPLCLAVLTWAAWEQSSWGRQAALVARLEAHDAKLLLRPDGLPPAVERWVEAPLKSVGLAPPVEMREWRVFQRLIAVKVKGPGSDRALRDIGACPSLVVLSANATDVSDASLRSVGQCPELAFVYLGDTLVTDQTLAILARLPRLERLDVSDTDVTETGLRLLANCHTLHTLHLDGTRVSDDAVAALATLPNLQNLSLSRTRVTDASLQSLLGTKSLRSLWLSESQVTTDGLVQFWRLRRDVDLDFDRWRPPALRALPLLPEAGDDLDNPKPIEFREFGP